MPIEHGDVQQFRSAHCRQPLERAALWLLVPIEHGDVHHVRSELVRRARLRLRIVRDRRMRRRLGADTHIRNVRSLGASLNRRVVDPVHVLENARARVEVHNHLLDRRVRLGQRLALECVRFAVSPLAEEEPVEEHVRAEGQVAVLLEERHGGSLQSRLAVLRPHESQVDGRHGCMQDRFAERPPTRLEHWLADALHAHLEEPPSLRKIAFARPKLDGHVVRLRRRQRPNRHCRGLQPTRLLLAAANIDDLGRDADLGGEPLSDGLALGVVLERRG